MATLLLIGAPVLAGPAGDAVRVQVAVAPEPGMHADAKALADSLKDLTKALTGVKEVVLVDAAKDAQVMVLVKDRGVGQRPAGYIGQMGQQPVQSWDPGRVVIAEEMWVQAILTAGADTKELVGSSPANTWGGCAKDIARQVRGWVKANAGRLASSHDKR